MSLISSFVLFQTGTSSASVLEVEPSREKLSPCIYEAMPPDQSPVDQQVEEQQLSGSAIDEGTEPDCTQDFIENELLNELKASCEELDTIATSESLPLSEQDDIIKPVLQFNLGDSASELKLNTSSTTVLCNSSISEEDSGFLSSEAIIAMRESDSGLLDSVRFADADDDSIAEEKIEQNLTKKDVVCI